MPNPVNPDLFSFATTLRATVETSNPVDQGRTFARGRSYLLSNRTLADMAGCSESHVRNMLKLLELPVVDQMLIEGGSPYKPFIAKAVEQESAAMAATEAEIDSAAKHGALVLSRWCKILDLSGPYAARVLVDVKARIAAAEAKKILRPSNVTWRGTPEEAFEAGKWPNDSSLRGVDKLNAAIRAVTRSLVRLIPNADARNRAITVALADPSFRGTGR